jgi:hypothetical protein
MRRRIEWGWISFALYVLSLVLPCLNVGNVLGGGTELAFGVICLLFGFFAVPWYANMLLLMAVVANGLRAYEAGIAFCILALVAALTTPWFLQRAETIHVGYFVWLASMVAMIANLVTKRAARLRFESPG